MRHPQDAQALELGLFNGKVLGLSSERDGALATWTRDAREDRYAMPKSLHLLCQV